MFNLTDFKNLTEFTTLYFSSTLSEEKLKIAVSAINILLSIAAFLGNALIITVLPNASFLHSKSKLLLGCLASTDLCVGLVAQPLYVNYLLCSNYSKHCYHFLLIFNFTFSIFRGVSLMTLTAISMDRLLAALLGLRYRQIINLRRVWVCAVTIWLLNIVNAVILHYLILYGFRILFVEVIMCLIVSACGYMKIYRTLRYHQAQVQHHVHQGQPNGEEIPLNIARYRKTVSSAMWVQISLVACYLPFDAVAASSLIEAIPPDTLDATLTLIMFNSTLNPFLYCWKIQEMKQAVKDKIRQLSCFSF